MAVCGTCKWFYCKYDGKTCVERFDVGQTFDRCDEWTDWQLGRCYWYLNYRNQFYVGILHPIGTTVFELLNLQMLRGLYGVPDPDLRLHLYNELLSGSPKLESVWGAPGTIKVNFDTTPCLFSRDGKIRWYPLPTHFDLFRSKERMDFRGLQKS